MSEPELAVGGMPCAMGIDEESFPFLEFDEYQGETYDHPRFGRFRFHRVSPTHAGRRWIWFGRAIYVLRYAYRPERCTAETLTPA